MENVNFGGMDSVADSSGAPLGFPTNMQPLIEGVRTPLLVHLDTSCTAGLRQVVHEATGLFAEVAADAAQVIIFGSDDIAYVNNNALYRSFPSKSICITESDTPTFRLPGLYAANQRLLVNRSRTRTISYFISERERGNQEVHRLIGEKTEKRFLYSFMGGSNSWARKRLLRAISSRADTIVEATNAYNHWNGDGDEAEARRQQRRRYAQVMAASKFTLCPRGCGLSSYRLFESMSLGVAPVIISDAWTPIEGIDWGFALFIREAQIPKIDTIMRAHESEWEQRGQAGLQIYRNRLAGGALAGMLYEKIGEVLAGYDPRLEAVMAKATQARAAGREAYWAGRDLVKHAVLWGFYLTGRAVPINLNRPLEVQLKRAPASGSR